MSRPVVCDEQLALLRRSVEEARQEFEAARAALCAAAERSPEIDLAMPNSAQERGRAAARYRLAEQHYAQALKAFIQNAHDFRLL
jgi:hypothetical protein